MSYVSLPRLGMARWDDVKKDFKRLPARQIFRCDCLQSDILEQLQYVHVVTVEQQETIFFCYHKFLSY